MNEHRYVLCGKVMWHLVRARAGVVADSCAGSVLLQESEKNLKEMVAISRPAGWELWLVSWFQPSSAAEKKRRVDSNLALFLDLITALRALRFSSKHSSISEMVGYGSTSCSVFLSPFSLSLSFFLSFYGILYCTVQ